MNRTELTKAIVWLDQLSAAAKVESAKLREQLSADARAEFEEQGTAPTWRIPDVATISASVSHSSVVVEREREFADWVAKRYPDEVETIVRPAFRKALLDSAVGDRIFGPVDASTGEVIPGCTIRPGGEYVGVSVRVSSDAKAVFAALAHEGLKRLAIDASPAVPVVLAELEAADAR